MISQSLGLVTDPKCLQTPTAVKELFDKVQPSNGTPTGAKLEKLLREYLQKLEKAQKKLVEHDDESEMRRCKPVNFIVITDGVPCTSMVQETPYRKTNFIPKADDPEPVIVQAAKRLDNGNFPITQVCSDQLNLSLSR